LGFTINFVEELRPNVILNLCRWLSSHLLHWRSANAKWKQRQGPLSELRFSPHPTSSISQRFSLKLTS